MSHPLFESLQNSSTPQELISSIQEIISKNDPSFRVKEIIPIILGKKQLILDNNNKDQQQKMIESIGDLFQWLMPYHLNLPPEDEEIEFEIFSAAYEFCAIQEVEAFFLEVIFPNAFEEDAIIATARTVSDLVNFGNERKLFTSFAATKKLLEMAVRAPTQLALEWFFGAIADITFDADDSVRQGYLTEENVKLFLQAFQRAEDGTCLEFAAEVLLSASFSSCNISRICTEEFASAVLNKLSITKSTDAVARICEFIVNGADSHSNFSSFFCTEDAAKIFLRASDIVNDDYSAEYFCFAIGKLGWGTNDEPRNFATQEFCAAIVRCFDFATTDDSRCGCADAIAATACRCKSARSIFANIPNIAEKLHEVINNMEDLNKASHLFCAIGSICFDKESARPFANLETLQLLVDSRKKVTNEKTLKMIDFAMNRIVFQFPEFLDFCAAQSDATSEHQLQLLRVETLEQLATFLEYDFDALFQEEIEEYVKRRSLLIICEKLDQFILSRKEENDDDDDEFQKSLSRICLKFYSLFSNLWFEFLNHRFLDSVVFSLLQHGTGETCVDAADLIRQLIQLKNSPALSSSILKVILEKMDEADEKSCFEEDENGECFFSVGIQLLRHPVLENSKDLSKTFFDDNLDLINRVFKKGYLLGDGQIRNEIDEELAKFRTFISRMTNFPQIVIEKESGQRRDRDGNPSTME
jgi:hypothetical protein